MIGFRSTVQGLLPILPSRVRRIGVFCLTHKCCPAACQPAALEVHLSSVGTKTASNQWRFRFEAHLFDHTDPLPGFQDHADAHVEAKLAETAFHGATVESWLAPLRTFASSFEGATAMSCNVNLGMVEVAALIVWPHWMRWFLCVWWAN